MSKDLHHIDDIFKNGLEGKEDIPSQKVWENIEKELDQKKSRRPFLLFPNSRKIAAILLISLGSAALFAGGYLLRGVQLDNAEKSQNRPPIEKNIPRSSGTRDAGTSLTPPGSNSTIRSDAKNGTKQEAVAGESNKVAGSINVDAETAVETEQKVKAEKAPPLASSSGNPSKNYSGSQTPSKPTQPEKLSRGTGTELSKVPAPEKAPQNVIADPSTTAVAANQTKKSGTLSNDHKAVADHETPATLSTNSTPEPSPTNQGEMKKSPSASPNAVDNTIPGTADNRSVNPASEISHQITEAPTSPNREIATEKQLPISTQAFSNNKLTVATSAAIPVLNKKQGSVNLPRFSLTPVVALQFGSNRIKENTAYANSGKVKDEITRTESQPSSIAGGILADLKISRNMTLQSGLVYTSRSIHIDPKNIIAERNPDGKVRYRFDCSAGTYFIKKAQGYTRPGDTAMTKFSTNDLNYLNIPLGLTYHFGGSEWHIFVMAGTGLNLLTRQYLETGLKYGYYEEEDTKVTNLNNSYFNGSLGAGIIWSPFKKISFTINPQYQFALTPMNTNMPVKALPRIFNIQAGMQIRL